MLSGLRVGLHYCSVPEPGWEGAACLWNNTQTCSITDDIYAHLGIDKTKGRIGTEYMASKQNSFLISTNLNCQWQAESPAWPEEQYTPPSLKNSYHSCLDEVRLAACHHHMLLPPLRLWRLALSLTTKKSHGAFTTHVHPERIA